MKKVDITWFCIAITFFIIGLTSNKLYLILGFSFFIIAVTAKDKK